MGSVITVSQDQYEMVRGKAQSSQDILISGNSIFVSKNNEEMEVFNFQ